MTPWPVAGHLLTGAVALVVLLAGFGSWAVIGRIDGAILLPGRVGVDRNRQVVQHPFGGIVSKVLVAEGDRVTQGDVLIRLDGSDMLSEHKILANQLLEIMAQQARLQAERDDAAALVFDPRLLAAPVADAAELMAGQQRLFQTRLETHRRMAQQLALQRNQIANRLSGIAAQQSSAAVQHRLIRQELSDQQSLLDRSLTPASRVLALQREQASLTGRIGDLTAQAAEVGARIREIDVQMLGLTATRREQATTALRDLQIRERELTEKNRILIRQIERLDIRAPVSGTIYGMQTLAPGSVIVAAAPLLFLVPQDQPLVITTQVRTSDISQIHIGQNVALRFVALDPHRSDELAGVITLLSADVFHDETTGEAYYRATIQLHEGETKRLPPQITLRPGMPVEAFALTGGHSPLEYFVRPMADYFNRALRER